MLEGEMNLYFEYIDRTCYLLESLVQCQHVRLDRR